MADIYFYNYLTHSKEKFTPVKKGKVTFYSCGPTVYDRVHIGNLRTYLFEDILRRVLLYNSYGVTQVMNLTDIEDKIIKKMKDQKKSLPEVTGPNIDLFKEDLEKLLIEKVEVYPKATEHIPEMIELIQSLLDKKIAYLNDGSVYFSLEKFPAYGKLSQLGKREIKVGARVDVDEYSKDNAEDFVLWKASLEGEPSYEAPFGAGRPGWHIECSAMSMKYLTSGQNKTIDLHTGAVDLLFPHHENEIAQSEAATGAKFVNYFLEGEHLLVEGQKMAKSLQNIFTLEDIIKKGINPLAFRYLVLTTHYQSKLNFTWDSLQAASNALNNLYETISSYPEPQIGCAGYEERFLAAINDNLDLPKAMSIVWELIKNDYPGHAKAQTLLKFDRVLGLGLDKIISQPVPGDIKELLALRLKFRQENNFQEADKIRDSLEEKGYLIKDTEKGVQVSKKYS